MDHKVLLKRSTMMVVCTEADDVESVLPEINRQHPSCGVWRVNNNFGPMKCSCKGLTAGRGQHFMLVPRMVKEGA